MYVDIGSSGYSVRHPSGSDPTFQSGPDRKRSAVRVGPRLHRPSKDLPRSQAASIPIKLDGAIDILLHGHRLVDGLASSLDRARRAAQAVADSGERYAQFVQRVRDAAPWRFERLQQAELDRDVLRLVDHHLEHLIPRVARYLDADLRRVIDFGCGSGGSAIAVALVYPDVRCTGFDIDPDEVALARERASLYGVAERCEF